MGNRAVICYGKYDPEALGIYLHWNGGRDSVEGFLGAAKEVMKGRMGDETYAAARLVQVIGNYIGGNLSLGIAKCKNLDCDNYDNGVYEVDLKTLEITGRKFQRGPEQKEYGLAEMTKDVLDAQPKKEVAA